MSSAVGDFTISKDIWLNTVTLNTTTSGVFYAALNTCGSGFLCVRPPDDYPSVYTFSFSVPIVAFGMYITGSGQSPSFPQDISFMDSKSLWTSLLPFKSYDAGQFIGFITDPNEPTSSVSILIGPSSFPIIPDSFGFDDVRFVSVPGPLPLLGVGAAFCYSRKLRNRIRISKTADIMSASK